MDYVGMRLTEIVGWDGLPGAHPPTSAPQERLEVLSNLSGMHAGYL